MARYPYLEVALIAPLSGEDSPITRPVFDQIFLLFYKHSSTLQGFQVKKCIEK